MLKKKIIKLLAKNFIRDAFENAKVEVTVDKPIPMTDRNCRFVRVNLTVKAGCVVVEEVFKNEKKFKELLKKEIEINVKHTRDNQENARS